MTDKTLYAMVDADGKVISLTHIGKFEPQKKPVSVVDGEVVYEIVEIETTVIPVDMIQPGDKYVDGKFVRANPGHPMFAVIRNSDGMLMHFTPHFGDNVVYVVPDPECVAIIGITTWDGESLVNPKPSPKTVGGLRADEVDVIE